MSEMLFIAAESAYLSGELLRKNLGKLDSSNIKKKAISDYVTDLDKASEKLIISAIKRNFPEHSIYSEEAGSLSGRQSQFKWIIDPLDGTTNFIHSYPFFSISIALEKNGAIVLGLVYDPLRKEFFLAEKNKGAFLSNTKNLKDKRKIKVTKTRNLSECLITTGFPFRIKDKIDVYLQSFRQIFFKSSGIRRTGSAALDLCYTACGRADGFWEMALSYWDIAAGSLIVEEAGGIVSDFSGGDTHFKTGNIAAGNPYVHPQIIPILKKIFV